MFNIIITIREMQIRTMRKHYIPIIFFKYLFVIYLAVPGLSCGTWDLLVVACGIFSCSMQTLSCSMWDLVP